MALQVIFMDAGQGDATLLIYPDGSLVLVDCGCIMNNGVVTKGIKTLLEEHLAKTGNRLRALVLTHPHQDHYNLVDKLIVKPEVTVDNIFIDGLVDQYQVNDLSVWLTKNKVLPLADHHLTDIPAAGLSIPAGNGAPRVDVRILAANTIGRDRADKPNENGIVLLVSHGDVNLFLMGDAVAATETSILDGLDQVAPGGSRFQNLLNGQRTALKVGHHGSATSSTARWITRIQPQLAFISSDTKDFNGTSLPRSTVVESLMPGQDPAGSRGGTFVRLGPD
jgi:beta-lactamase superfamily II metal-dependent hydrolase